MKILKANRSASRIRLAMQGPSGSGKTYSALLLASGITDWSKIVVIDTEDKSSHLYSELGEYNVLSLSEPYSPERFIEAIDHCENAGMEVIIIDSITHEWEGNGGILNIHSNMTGNSFTNWGKLTPRHNEFVKRILSSKAHIIATMRTKQDYVLSDKNGKTVPEKVGLKAIQRDGMDYEFTIVFEVDINHYVIASKDRTNLFVGRPQFQISQKTGQQIQEWCNSSNSIDLIDQINATENLDELSDLYFQDSENNQEFTSHFQRRKQELLKNVNSNKNGIYNQ